MSGKPERAELTLGFEGGRWRATGCGVDVAHAELAALDGLIVRAFAARRRPCRVHVRFDAALLPRWTRQHQAHYFNYVLSVDAGGEPHD